jgi:hypothetical protein
MNNIPMAQIKSISVNKDLNLIQINNKRTSARGSNKIKYSPLELE